jgi:hypothetical protein
VNLEEPHLLGLDLQQVATIIAGLDEREVEFPYFSAKYPSILTAIQDQPNELALPSKQLQK